MVYYPDPDAIAVLCEHAKGSFRLLVGLHAAQVFDMLDLDAHAFDSVARCRSRGIIEACTVGLTRRASEADLLEGLHTARTVFAAGDIFAFRHGTLFNSDLFAAHAPVVSLTDRVVAEMSVMQSDVALLSPELDCESRNKQKQIRDVRYTRHAVRAVSRLLLSRFGTHVPSWDMFKHLYIPEARIGDAIDLVFAVEQSR